MSLIKHKTIKKCEHFGNPDYPPIASDCWHCLGFVECKTEAGIPVSQEDIDMVSELRGARYE